MTDRLVSVLAKAYCTAYHQKAAIEEPERHPDYCFGPPSAAEMVAAIPPRERDAMAAALGDGAVVVTVDELFASLATLQEVMSR